MILNQIVQDKKKVVARRKEAKSLEEIKKALGEGPFDRPDFAEEISLAGVNLIAEIKKRSPSKGIFKKEFNPVLIAYDYEAVGARALSVLTNERFFDGNIEYIKDIKKAVRIPVLEKDFIIDEYQVYEAAFYGADAILLIAGILSTEELGHLRDISESLNMSVLCEVHNEEDLGKALKIDAEIIGINNRNLHDFSVDLETTARLVPKIPRGKIIVSESGIKTNSDVLFLKSLGVNAVLIGEAFMESADIREKVKEIMEGC